MFHSIEFTRWIVVACVLILISGTHIRAARGLLGWTQRELAKRAKVALGTIRRMEELKAAGNARAETLIKVTAVLEKAGVEFLDDDRPGVRLLKKS